MKRKNKLIMLIGLISLIIMIIPIGVINIKEVKTATLLVFKNKENSYQYLQFIGSFLGVLIPLAIAFISVDHQINKEKQLQVQIKLRDELYKKITIVKRDIKLLKGEISAVKWSSEGALKDNEPNLSTADCKFRETVRDNYNKIELKYHENMADFQIELENSIKNLQNFSYDTSVIQMKIQRVDKLTTIIGLKVSGFPEVGNTFLKGLIESCDCLYIDCDELYLELNTFASELDKYYK